MVNISYMYQNIVSYILKNMPSQYVWKLSQFVEFAMYIDVIYMTTTQKGKSKEYSALLLNSTKSDNTNSN